MLEARSRIEAVWRGLVEGIYPRRCCLCGLAHPQAICPSCRADFRPIVVPPDLDRSLVASVHVVHAYRGRAGQAVRRLKYERAMPLGEPMAEELALRSEALLFDAAVPVPIHWTRWCQRGFNQAELLCQGLPKNVVRMDLLRRRRRTRPQVGLSEQDRMTNLTGAFEATAARGLHVLLVDDVVTTGGTALECARALRQAGAASVKLLAYAGRSGEYDPLEG